LHQLIIKLKSKTFNINTKHSKSMNNWEENNQDDRDDRNILTLPNIKYIVEALNVLLQTNLDGEKRSQVISLREKLINRSSSIINDFN
jgi:hypothetical protein